MAFELRVDESVPKGVRRVVKKEIDKALDELTGKAEMTADEMVHSVRKRIKKVRAVLRLVRPELGGKTYRRENRAFRASSRPLSEVRDAHSLILALDKLREGYEQELPFAVWSRIRQALERQEQGVKKEILEGGDTLQHIRTTLQDARDRLKDWSFAHKGFAALRPGLKETYQCGQEAFEVAFSEPTDENLHDCRKRVQDLRHHFTLLKPTRPEVLGGLADKGHEMSDRLGDDHDLAVLRQLLTASPSPLGLGADDQIILPLIDRRREELRQEATEIGELVYRARPKDFLNRLRPYWHLARWQAEVASQDGARPPADLGAEQENLRLKLAEASHERDALDQRLCEVQEHYRQAEEELRQARADTENLLVR